MRLKLYIKLQKQHHLSCFPIFLRDIHHFPYRAVLFVPRKESQSSSRADYSVTIKPMATKPNHHHAANTTNCYCKHHCSSRGFQPTKERVDLLNKGLVKIDYENGNRLLPSVTINERYFHDLCTPCMEQNACDQTLG